MRITITLPENLYQKIKEQAARDTRTIGEEITHLLKLHVPGYSDDTMFTPTSTFNDILKRKEII